MKPHKITISVGYIPSNSPFSPSAPRQERYLESTAELGCAEGYEASGGFSSFTCWGDPTWDLLGFFEEILIGSFMEVNDGFGIWDSFGFDGI